MLISVEQAQARILAQIKRLPGEPVVGEDLLGRVPLEPVLVRLDQPPFDNSAMDGYAVRWDDLSLLASGATEVVDLQVDQVLGAGSWSKSPLEPGRAARIMTGAAMPEGADLVVMQEKTESVDGGSSVRILQAGTGPGDNVRRAGEDLRVGEQAVGSTRPLGSADLALVSSQGLEGLQCVRRPIVSIISTGDEIQEPGENLRPGQIHAGNSRAIEALVREAGGIPRYLGIARDNPESLREVFSRVEGSDAVVTIGGVSVGEFDFVKDVLDDLGGVQHFWKVAMRPGKPNACGTLAGVPYFGLPGNPVSCLVSFLQFVRPALLKMSGLSDLFLPTRSALMEHSIRSRRGFLFFYRGILEETGTGLPRVRTTGPQGSGIMRSMAAANCLIVVPEETEEVAPGDRVRVQLLPTLVPSQSTAGLRLEQGET